MSETNTAGLISRAARIWSDVLDVEQPGPDDNLFELGATSLAAARIAARLRAEFEVELTLRTLFEHPTLAELVPYLRPGDRMDRPADVPSTSAAPSTAADRPIGPESDHGALSWEQERLWFLDQLAPQGAAYVVPAVARCPGTLDVDLLQRSVNVLVARHDALRSTFVADGGRPVRRTASTISVPVAEIDLSDAADPSRSAEEEAHRAAATAFDLSTGPLLRVCLLRLGPQESRLLLTLHHIVSDGWSVDLLLRELGSVYRALSAGRAPALPELPVRYADWVSWQRRQLAGSRLTALTEWWTRQLAGAPPVLELPIDRARPRVQGERGAVHPSELPPALTDRLQAFAQREGATPFMVVLAALYALLHRCTGATDLVVGTPVANRTRPEVEGVVGFFVNTAVLRCRLDDQPTFRQLVRRVRELTLESFARQEMPFGRLVEALNPPRSLAHNPVVQVVLAARAHAAPPAVDGDQLFRLDRSATGHGGTAKFDLTLYLEQVTNGAEVSWEYNTDLFDAQTVRRLAGNLRTLLREAIQAADVPVDRIPVLSDRQRVSLLRRFAGPVTPVPVAGDLPRRFAETAGRFPDRVAVTDTTRSMTYRELDRAANRLAHRLLAEGAGPERLVAICADRDLDYVVAVLAVLKTGAGYLPLDPTYPADRIAFTVADADCTLVVGQQRYADRFGLPFVAWDDGAGGNWPAHQPPVDPDPDSVAYVIYTSGSTGRPKGVMVTHRNVLRLFPAVRLAGGYRPDDVFSLFHSFAFDFSVWELWGALLHGGQVVVVPYLTSRDPDALFDLLLRERVTVLSQTPSAFRQLTVAAERRGFPRTSLRLVVFGGEALDPAVLRTWIDRYGDRTPLLVNMYGITETTVHVTERVLTAADLDRPQSPIGHPLADLRVQVLDPELRPVPPGVLGELYVGGAGVSLGYLGRPALTAARFVPDPYGEPGQRLYRTGDLAFRREDGSLCFRGRVDDQVQLRGFRIELGEVAHALMTYPGVRGAAAAVRPDVSGEPRLVGYVTAAPDVELDPAQVRAGVARWLPAHMVPSAVLVLDRLPMTANGKLDRAALPTPTGGQAAERAGTPPRTATERAIASVWSQLLGVDRVAVEDNFFALGGHSLLVTRMVTEIRAELAVDLPVRWAFELPDLAGLADAVDALVPPGPPTRVSSRPQRWLLGYRPVADARIRLLCLPYAGGGGSVFADWAEGLPPDVELCAVQLPGRQNRLAEPPLRELDALVEAVDVALRPLADLPWALFGHSFGGIVAFELARRLRERRLVRHLLVSSARPPHVYRGRRASTDRPDDELIAELLRNAAAEGTADRTAQADLLAETVLPAYRADLTMLDRYRPRWDGPPGSRPLDVPLSVFGGADDPTPSPQELQGWADYTTGPTRLRIFEGGHFHLRSSRSRLLAAITEDLGRSPA
ncbi:amino acid adenylation domain-containing protein [Solwaraspora sp. WMMD1047]|uniref:amino acid adenylation domain-containing protein n=1 Tax=Solwaraspora sp. WMMD1047 TaxID=3016102 RepID=UPI002417E3A0|nr:amino acid adenylation domain-containing protein [Solwaraspora sp. WMMD1047]MDG4834251.1 amino acid adenylation domain-containing protein [Solwaraspora sp. WMMD1047]